MMQKQDKPIPTITVGRYAGKKIDTLPNSYLRWIISQNFPKEWTQCAIEKLEKSDHSEIYLNVTRHALDMFSKRFLFKWIQSENDKGDKCDGLATFIAKNAQEAWENGTNVSKYRHQDDGIVKEWRDIRWIFNINKDFPDYRDVITVTSIKDESY